MKGIINMNGSGWHKEVREHIKAQLEEMEESIVTVLCYVGEKAVSYARDNGEYRNITGNLRSSINYIVLKDGEPIQIGEPVTYPNLGGDGEGQDGASVASELLDRLKDNYPEGYVLIVCAGMNYASYVEDLHGLDVLTGSQLDAEKTAERMIKKLFN